MKIGNFRDRDIAKHLKGAVATAKKNNDFREFILQFPKVSFCHTGNQFFTKLVGSNLPDHSIS